jgi:hypothetical protein
VARIDPAYALAMAGGALVVVFLPGAFLVLGASDEVLEGQQAALSEHLAEARLAQEALDEEKARREHETLEEETRARAVQLAPPPPRPVPTRHCPYCDEVILARAVKCKHCGELLDERLRRTRVREGQPRWNPGVAAVLSFIIPGLGQMYKGQVLNGLCWFVLVLMGYPLCVAPGLLLHLFCIIGAASGDPYSY